MVVGFITRLDKYYNYSCRIAYYWFHYIFEKLIMCNYNHIIYTDWKVFLKTKRGSTFSVKQKAVDDETAKILAQFKFKELGCKVFYAESIECLGQLR